MRYLAELAWFRHALVANRALECRTIDGATIGDRDAGGGLAHAGPPPLHPAGDIVAASSTVRPRAVRKSTIDTPFRGEFRDYRVLGGIRIPTTATASWQLPEGRLAYFRCRMSALAARR